MPTKGGLPRPGEESEQPSHLQQAKAFGMLEAICPALAGDEVFDQQENLYKLRAAAVSSRLLPAVTDAAAKHLAESAGQVAGSMAGGTAGPAIGGAAAKVAWTGLHDLIRHSKGADESVLVWNPDRARGPADAKVTRPSLPDTAALTTADLLAWLKDQVIMLADEITRPGVQAKRACWRIS